MLLSLLANQPPSDFFHDPFGQFIINIAVALIVGFSSAGAAIWIFRKQQAHKILAYQIISDAPLASVNKAVENRVTIQLDGQPVQDAKLLVIRVQNTGNAAIKHDDYEDPLAFVFPGRTIVGNDILATEPADLMNALDKKSFIKLGTETAEMEKFLLNPKQSVTFTVFLTGASDQLNVRGRLVDGQIVKYIELKKTPSWIAGTAGATAAAVSLMGFQEVFDVSSSIAFALATSFVIFAMCVLISRILLVKFGFRFY